MKKSVILIVTIVAMAFPSLTRAQTDAEKSLDWARNMVKVTTGLANDFATFKGDFLQKDDSENSYYTAKDIDVGTTRQYVIITPKGSGRFAAIYVGADKDDKTPAMAFAAFTGGIITLNNGGGDLTVTHDDAQPSGTLKYYLSVKGTKVASFTFDITENKGTLLVAWQ